MGMVKRIAMLGMVMVLFHAMQGTWTAVDATDGNSSTIDAIRCEVQFLEEVEVPALKPGPVARVVAKLNDEVKRGAVLAELDNEHLQVQRQTAKLERDAAAERIADDVELQFALTAQREADAELSATQQVLQRTPGAVTEANLRRLRLTAERAALDVEQTRKARRLAEIALAIRSTELQTLDRQLEWLSITSPMDGVVRELNVQPREWIGEGQMVAKVARMDRLRIDALVDGRKHDAARLIGSRVSVTWNQLGAPRACHGKVTSVDPQMYAGGQWRVHAEIENQRLESGWSLLPGMEVQLTIYPGAAGPGGVGNAAAAAAAKFRVTGEKTR